MNIPSGTSGECEAHCAMNHKWQTEYKGEWSKDRAREGKRRKTISHKYTLAHDKCPACGNPFTGFQPTKFN